MASTADYYKALRRLAHERTVADLRDGRRQRATTIPDKKRQASKSACRGKVAW